MKFAEPDELSNFLDLYPDVEVLELLMPDFNGLLRCKRIHRNEFDPLFGKGMLVPRSAPLLGIRGDFYEGIPASELGGDPDQLIKPISGTLATVPWYDSPVAQVMIGYVSENDEVDWVDARYPLLSVLKILEESGFFPTVATELEFYLLDQGSLGRPQPLRGKIPGTNLLQEGIQYCMSDDLFDCDDFLNDVRLASGAQNVPLTTIHSEFSPGQWEINTHHQADAIVAGHHALLLRRIVKGVARKHGFGATFMAKPFADIPGSGMHIHCSIYDKSAVNIFADPFPIDPPRLTLPLRHALAGLGELLDESMLCLAPNPNSYRRFKAGGFAPSGKSWGYDHREVAFRIPKSSEHDRRIEHRIAGADANPYLALATVLAGIHKGLELKKDPGPAVPREADLSKDQTTLPTRLDDAIELFKSSETISRYFGPQFTSVYSAIRKGESDDYHDRIPDLDYEWYLRAL